MTLRLPDFSSLLSDYRDGGELALVALEAPVRAR